MPLSINTNIASLTAQRAMLNSNSALETSFERLSTGKRINSAADDAAGLAIGKDLESRVSGLNQAVRNVNDGISMVQIAEGALDEVTSILQRMRDLAVQASNGSLSSTERGYLDTEQSKLATTLGAVIDQSQFNGTDLVSDSAATPITIQSGADASDTIALSFAALSEAVLDVTDAEIDLTGSTSRVEKLTFDTSGLSFDGVAFTSTAALASSKSETEAAALTYQDADGNALGAAVTSATNQLIVTFTAKAQHSTVTISDGTTSTANGTETIAGIDDASNAISTIDRALATVASERATLGATQAQLESTVRNLANVAENTSAAAGRIMDTDYAAETANLTKAQILQQAATSVLAQANAQPQSVLSLLQ
jgi:flagellin